MLFQKKKKLPAPDRAQLPRHIAVVMDGNGRWAQKRGMPRTVGHSAGSECRRSCAYWKNTCTRPSGRCGKRIFAFSFLAI